MVFQLKQLPADAGNQADENSVCGLQNQNMGLKDDRTPHRALEMRRRVSDIFYIICSQLIHC